MLSGKRAFQGDTPADTHERDCAGGGAATHCGYCFRPPRRSNEKSYAYSYTQELGELYLVEGLR